MATVEFARIQKQYPGQERPAVRDLSLDVHDGELLVMLGPSGCGKSSILRVLAGLWPFVSGHISKPSGTSGIFFLPQRPYMVIGSLREQIMYPMHRQKWTKEYVYLYVL